MYNTHIYIMPAKHIYNIVFRAIIVDNVKYVSEPRVYSFNVATWLCVGDTILVHVAICKFKFFPWQKFVWGDTCVTLFFWQDEFCAWLGWSFFFCVIWPITLIASGPAHIDQPYLTFDFQMNFFSQITIFIPAYSLSLLLYYHQYHLLCDKVTHRNMQILNWKPNNFKIFVSGEIKGPKQNN